MARGRCGAEHWAASRVVRRLATLLAVLATLATALAGCGASAAPGSDARGIQRMLDRRAAALLHRDPGGFLAAVDPAADGYRAEQRRVFGNLADVPLADWRYQLIRTGGFEPARGDGRRIAAQVRFRYRLTGHDTAPVTAVQRLTVTQRGGRWYVASEEPQADGGRRQPRQLWEQGRVTVARGSHSLVLGVGQDPGRLREIARTADRAVPAVEEVWRGGWAHRVVVLVPASVETMAELLGAPAAGYKGIAAVTTGEAGGSGRAPANRVIVNPEAYAVLGALGQRVVLTHETAHVATRADTSAATPLWLSEGFADWAGYRGTDRTPQQTAPTLTREAAAGRLPRELPSDADFGFAGDGDRLGRAYEGAWLACRLIAERWGEDRLVALYRAAGRGGSVDRAVRATLHLSTSEFTALWRSYVQRELS